MKEQLFQDLSKLDAMFQQLEKSKARSEKAVSDLMNDLEKEVAA